MISYLDDINDDMTSVLDKYGNVVVSAGEKQELQSKIMNSYYDKLQKDYEDKTLNENSIVICHSIGNPYFIRFCRRHNFVPNNYIAVAPGAVYQFLSSRTDYIVEVKKQAYLKQEDFDYAGKFKNIYLLYSDEDDKNIEKFTRFSKDFNTKDMYLKGYNHFDGYHRIYQIPELINLINTLIYYFHQQLGLY